MGDILFLFFFPFCLHNIEEAISNYDLLILFETNQRASSTYFLIAVHARFTLVDY